MPSGELIRSEQKKRATNCWMDFLQVGLVQLSTDGLSVTLRITGWGSSVIFVVVIMCSETQQLMITVINSSTLMETLQAVSIVFFVYEHTLDHFVRERNIPPESEGNRVPSCTFKAAVSK